MKKLVVLFFILVCGYGVSFADELQEDNTTDVRRELSALKAGYKGFVDFGYTFAESDNAFGGERLEFITTHGYQCSSHFFIGAGFGLHHYKNGGYTEFPVFLDLRANMFSGQVTPFIDGKIMLGFGDGFGFYLTPSIGCRVATDIGIGLNFSLGYVVGFNTSSIMFGCCDCVGRDDRSANGISLKIGVDF